MPAVIRRTCRLRPSTSSTADPAIGHILPKPDRRIPRSDHRLRRKHPGPGRRRAAPWMTSPWAECGGFRRGIRSTCPVGPSMRLRGIQQACVPPRFVVEQPPSESASRHWRRIDAGRNPESRGSVRRAIRRNRCESTPYGLWKRQQHPLTGIRRTDRSPSGADPQPDHQRGFEKPELVLGFRLHPKPPVRALKGERSFPESQPRGV